MSKKILIIDDDPLNVSVIREALGHAWDLTVEKNVEKGVAAAEELGAPLIIMNVIIKGATAFDFVAKLSETKLGLSVPIVYLSSMEERHEMHRAMRLGGTGYIFKPLDIQEIQLTVRNQMRLFECRD